MITKNEEQIYRLCHQDFGGLATKEAAKKMGIGQRRVQQLLKSLKIKSPQLFPVFTRQQAKVEELLNGWGYTYKQAADKLHITISTVGSIVKTLKAKGVYFGLGKQILQYKPGMDDGRIKEKF